MDKKILIVIASFADGYLDDLLYSIENNTKDVDYAIQVVDNHKDKQKIQDLVIKVCQEHKVPYHLDTEITGYGDALNKGVEISEVDSKYILYMDSDCLVSKGWLREMIDCYERHKEEGCRLVGPLVKNFDEKYLPEMFNYSKKQEDWEFKDLPMTAPTYLVGVCYLRERATIPEYTWDKNFLRAYSEDSDFSNQVRFWKNKIWVAGKSLIYHKVNSSHETMKKEDVVPQIVGAANKYYLNQKWASIKKLGKKFDEKRLREFTLGLAFKREGF